VTKCNRNVEMYIPEGWTYRLVLVKCGVPGPDGSKLLCSHCQLKAEQKPRKQEMSNKYIISTFGGWSIERETIGSEVEYFLVRDGNRVSTLESAVNLKEITLADGTHIVFGNYSPTYTWLSKVHEDLKNKACEHQAFDSKAPHAVSAGDGQELVSTFEGWSLTVNSNYDPETAILHHNGEALGNASNMTVWHEYGDSDDSVERVWVKTLLRILERKHKEYK